MIFYHQPAKTQAMGCDMVAFFQIEDEPDTRIDKSLNFKIKIIWYNIIYKTSIVNVRDD